MSASSTGVARQACELTAQLRGLGPEALNLADVQVLMELAVVAFGRIRDDEREYGPILQPYAGVTATDVSRTASALLKAVKLEVFELALWESWGGRPWSAGPANEHSPHNKLES